MIETCPGRMPISPLVPGTTTSSHSICRTSASGVTMASLRATLDRSFFLRALHHVVDAARVHEELLRDLVVAAFADLFERTDRVFEIDVFAGRTRELLRDEERLREELLQAPRARH